jgi:hypothetical protein
MGHNGTHAGLAGSGKKIRYDDDAEPELHPQLLLLLSQGGGVPRRIVEQHERFEQHRTHPELPSRAGFLLEDAVYGRIDKPLGWALDLSLSVVAQRLGEEGPGKNL